MAELLEPTPRLGDVDPQSPARTWQQLRCTQAGCLWGWEGYLPIDSSTSLVASKPIVEEHFRRDHPDVQLPTGE